MKYENVRISSLRTFILRQEKLYATTKEPCRFHFNRFDGLFTISLQSRVVHKYKNLLKLLNIY